MSIICCHSSFNELVYCVFMGRIKRRIIEEEKLAKCVPFLTSNCKRNVRTIEVVRLNNNCNWSAYETLWIGFQMHYKRRRLMFCDDEDERHQNIALHRVTKIFFFFFYFYIYCIQFNLFIYLVDIYLFVLDFFFFFWFFSFIYNTISCERIYCRFVLFSIIFFLVFQGHIDVVEWTQILIFKTRKELKKKKLSNDWR